MMNKKVDATQIKEWVILDRDTNEPHYFETWDEALHSPIKGHVMSKFYYLTTYQTKN